MKLMLNNYKYKAADENEDETDNDKREENDVFMEGNSIFFYTDVSKQSVAKLNRMLMSMQTELLHKYIGIDAEPHINLYIHSEGGCVFSGLSAMNHIASSKIDVHTIIDGFVASAATFLSLGGKKRYIMPYSTVLIHQMRTEFYGKHDELKDEVENCDNIMHNFKTIYKSQTSLPEKTLNQLLKRELYLTTEKCLKYNVAHELKE